MPRFPVYNWEFFTRKLFNDTKNLNRNFPTQRNLFVWPFFFQPLVKIVSVSQSWLRAFCMKTFRYRQMFRLCSWYWFHYGFITKCKRRRFWSSKRIHYWNCQTLPSQCWRGKKEHFFHFLDFPNIIKSVLYENFSL